MRIGGGKANVTEAPDPQPITARPGDRSFGALGRMVTRQLRFPNRASFAADGVIVLGVFTAWSPVGPEGLIGLWVAGLVASLADVGIPLLLMGQRMRLAIAAETFRNERVRRDWRARTGEFRQPRTPGAAQLWLEKHPPSEAIAAEIPWIHLLAGDPGSARAALERLPTPTAAARFEKAELRWDVDFSTGMTTDLTQLRSAAAEIEDPDDRTFAEAEVAHLEARVALAEDRDWLAPLAHFGQLLPGRGYRSLLLRDYAWQRSRRNLLLLPVLLLLTLAHLLNLNVLMG
jgi:hypothetical protein